MRSKLDVILEQGVLALDTIRRRWWILALTVAITTALAFIVVKTTPHRFTTSTMILLKSANQVNWTPGGSQFPDQNAAEQLRAIEAWMKSDHVLNDLIPQLMDKPEVLGERKLLTEKTKLRSDLRLSLIGTSILRLELDGPAGVGLSRKLEIILSNFLERLLRTDDGVLNATQLIMSRRSDDASAAEKALIAEIDALGLEPATVIRQFRELRRLAVTRATNHIPAPADPIQAGNGSATPVPTTQTEDEIRHSISPRIEVVHRLEELYAQAVQARTMLERAQATISGKENSYFKIFESPENLTIIGRPRDPIYGENPARKVAIAIILLSVLVGAALAFLADILSGRIRTQREFENLSELPVIGRLQRIPS